VKEALFDRAVAEGAPDRLVEVRGGGPADVAAARAFARVVPWGTKLGRPGRSTAEAFDDQLFHALGIGEGAATAEIAAPSNE
jgi:hypothetical protein